MSMLKAKDLKLILDFCVKHLWKVIILISVIGFWFAKMHCHTPVGEFEKQSVIKTEKR